YKIFKALAERLGLGDEFTDGKTEEDWVEKTYEDSDMPRYISFDEFKKKGYFVVPMPEDYKATPGLRWFYEGRGCDTPDLFNPKRRTAKAKEIGTYSGKIEFASESLKKHLPDDKERPVVAHYIESWEGHKSEVKRKYPLQLITPHPRFSFHTEHDSNTSWITEIPGHRTWKDGYYWHPARLNPADATARSIKNGDIILLFNDRGGVLCIADVTERVRKGVVHSYYGSGKYEPLEPGNPESIEKAGCVSILTPSRMMSQNVPGMAPNSCLIEVQKWEG
ncbi:MAG TPA: molybdopterin dinucleotide binding domain-containing protein, partial [Dehalococcoidales bacterium]|nr:molybdopterin dinucleotide binding domain-containing protein [Dehalococcoidales bacterium]